jgi:hypothetical protein
MKKESIPNFRYQHCNHASMALLQDLGSKLAASAEPQVRALETELAALSPFMNPGDPVTLAFVGQYNAGKSTLIKGLTGNATIAIDSDVCTHEVTAYDWSGIRIVDTPGIHAGFPGHDKLSEAQIDRSHLLVFVITGELFGEDMAVYFRDLAFGKGFAPKMMLVVNKMDIDPGSAEAKRFDIERVIHPRKMEDFRTVFVSGEIYLEALGEPDPAEQAALIAASGMTTFMEELDKFARECGLLGALTAPLFGTRSIAMQAAGTCGADRPEERAAVELLGRRARILRDSRNRLSLRAERLLDAALADLSLIGDHAAGGISPSKTKEEIEAAIAKAEQEAHERVDRLKADMPAAIEEEKARLESELELLAQGDLASRLAAVPDQGVEFDPDDRDGFKGTSARPADSSAAERARQIGRIAKGVGDWLTKVSTGSKGISGWGKAAAAGSDAHKVIYQVGKFFGHSFNPWEAVGYASKIAKIGKILGPITSMLQVVGQVIEDKREDAERIEFQNARSETRAIFRDGAMEIRQQFLARLDEFLNDFYGSMQAETDELIAEVTNARSQRGGESSAFAAIADQASALIREIEHLMEA